MSPSQASTPAAPLEGASAQLLQEYGRRISRDTIVYAVGTGGVLVFSLVTLAVFTHYMPPSEYGDLSILFGASGALTILLNLIPLAGILRWVYVAGEADSGAIDDPSRQAPGGTKRRALGTGWWMNLGSIAIGCGILALLRAPLASLLIGRASATTAVSWMIASSAAGALFRLTSNVVRMERRPVAFSIITGVRPAIALAVSTPLVIAGHGLSGALVGTTAGSFSMALVSLAITRRSYSLAFHVNDAKMITDLGFRYTLVIIGLFIVHNGDALVMSRFANAAAVGVYRVASRLSSIISYLVSAFLLAWAPLERSTLFQTTYAQHGADRMHSRMLTYYVLSALTVTLGLGLAGQFIVQLSPPAYRDAANLIPFASFAFLFYGLFVVIARTTYHPHRDFVHNWSAALAAVVYVALAALLVPRIGAYGLAIAAATGMAVACAWFRLIVPGSTHHAALEWPRLIGGTLIAFGCLALGRTPGLGDAPRILLGLAIFFGLYPAALILSGVVPRPEARQLAAIAIGLGGALVGPITRRRHGSPTVATALSELSPEDVELLHALVKENAAPAALAHQLRVGVSVLHARAARSLRTMTGATGEERDDSALGHWLFDVAGSAEHDAVGNFLVERGIPWMTLHRVEYALRALRALPESRWPVTSDRPRLPAGSRRADEPGLLGTPSLELL